MSEGVAGWLALAVTVAVAVVACGLCVLVQL